MKREVAFGTIIGTIDRQCFEPDLAHKHSIFCVICAQTYHNFFFFDVNVGTHLQLKCSCANIVHRHNLQNTKVAIVLPNRDKFDEETKARHEAVIKRYAIEKTRKENK